MKSIHRKLLALAAHEGTPQEEALVAVRKLAEMIERGHDSNFRVTSYNSTRDRIAELEAEIIVEDEGELTMVVGANIPPPPPDLP